jgi:hypothetical protein
MQRAWDKACAEMAPGTWLVSLEFVVPDRRPDLQDALPSGRAVSAWRVPGRPAAAAAAQPGRRPADIPGE